MLALFQEGKTITSGPNKSNSKPDFYQKLQLFSKTELSKRAKPGRPKRSEAEKEAARARRAKELEKVRTLLLNIISI